MSNRTSHATFKESLLSAGVNPTDTITKLLREEVTKQPICKSREVYRLLQKHKIKVFNPISIPEPQQVAFFEILPQFTNIFAKQEQLGEITQVVVKNVSAIPGYTKLTPDHLYDYGASDINYLPSYFPNYFTAPQDQTLYSQVFHFYSLNIGLGPTQETIALDGYDHASEAKYIYGEKDSLHYYGTKYAYTSGTLEGQIERLKENTAVNRGDPGFHKVKTLSQQGHTFDTVGRILERFLPLPAYNEEEDTPLSGNYSDFIRIITDDKRRQFLLNDAPTYHPKTKAGMPFRQVALKKDVKWDCIVAANLFLSELAEALSFNELSRVKDLMKQWWFLSVGYFFPKAERYELTHRDHETIKYDLDPKTKKYKQTTTMEHRFEAKKTRNIWSMPFISHLLASQNKVRLDRYPAVNYLNSDHPSLYKFSPWKGGMDTLMSKLLKFVEGVKLRDTLSLVYADNWYLLEVEVRKNKAGEQEKKARWLSLDQTKGEANITRSHVNALENYILQTCYTIETGDKLQVFYNSTWGYLCRNIISTLAVDTVGLLGNMFINIPGQGSGNTDTFFANHTATALCVDLYEKRKKPKMSVEVLNKLAETTGVDWKIELDTGWNFLDMIKIAQNEGFTGQPKLKSPTVLTVDVLGYDAVYDIGGKRWVPVLAKDRLFRSAMLPKAMKSSNNVVIAMYQNIRYNSIIMSGGWAYPALHQALKSLSDSNFKKFQKLGEQFTDMYIGQAMEGIEISMDMLQDPDIAKYIGGVAPALTFEELTKLMFDKVTDERETPVIGRYVPMKSSKANHQTFLIAPGFNIKIPFRGTPMYREIPIHYERWIDSEEAKEVFGQLEQIHFEQERGKASFTREQKFKINNKVGRVAINRKLTRVENGDIQQYFLTNDSGFLSVTKYLTEVPFTEKWAKFRTMMPERSFVDPTEQKVFFEKKSGKIIRDPYKRIHKTTTPSETKDMTRTQKQNVKKRYGELNRHKIAFTTEQAQANDEVWKNHYANKITTFMKTTNRGEDGILKVPMDGALEFLDSYEGYRAIAGEGNFTDDEREAYKYILQYNDFEDPVKMADDYPQLQTKDKTGDEEVKPEKIKTWVKKQKEDSKPP